MPVLKARRLALNHQVHTVLRYTGTTTTLTFRGMTSLSGCSSLSAVMLVSGRLMLYYHENQEAGLENNQSLSARLSEKAPFFCRPLYRVDGLLPAPISKQASEQLQESGRSVMRNLGRRLVRDATPHIRLANAIPYQFGAGRTAGPGNAVIIHRL